MYLGLAISPLDCCPVPQLEFYTIFFFFDALFLNPRSYKHEKCKPWSLIAGMQRLYSASKLARLCTVDQKNFYCANSHSRRPVLAPLSSDPSETKFWTQSPPVLMKLVYGQRLGHWESILASRFVQQVTFFVFFSPCVTTLTSSILCDTKLSIRDTLLYYFAMKVFLRFFLVAICANKMATLVELIISLLWLGIHWHFACAMTTRTWQKTSSMITTALHMSLRTDRPVSPERLKFD
jgi:hypothetical protein